MITNVGTITFPVLFEPKENLSGVLKYSCSLLIPKTDVNGIAKIKAEIAKAVTKGKDKHWGGKVPKFKYEALRDGDAELASGDKEGAEYKGMFFLNCSAGDDSPPGVVGPDARPLMDRHSIYSGCQVRLDVRAFPYKSGGNNGIGWWLSNCMLIGDGPRLDGKMNAVDAFAEFAVNDTSDDDEIDDDSIEAGDLA